MSVECSPDVLRLVRDIEMTYEVLFAFLRVHKADPAYDDAGAWAAARQQVEDAIRAAYPSGAQE